MSDNLGNNNNEKYTHIIEFNDLEYSMFSSNPDIVKYESFSFKPTNPSLITKFFKELLEELYIILLDMDIASEIYLIDELINNCLMDYDLDPENVLEIMTSSSQNIFCYSSLIGYFYQCGIGCKVDKAKALEIFSNAIKYDQKVESNQFSFDQMNEIITDDIKKLNEIISQYFYSLILYKNVILIRRYNYKLHIKNAEKGDSTSQYFIGNCYYFGINIKCDYDKAIEWYLKASEGGNIQAMYMLGECYEYGQDVNEKKAFEFYFKSAKECKNASSTLGDFYYYGKGISKDESKAFEWYLRAAEKGDAFSQYLVANYYYDGKYIPKNEEKWLYWNRKAAINGEINAQYKLAEYYLDNPINKNDSKAFKWYLKLANKNSLRAVYLVAKCCRDGIGTDKNIMEATKWIEKCMISPNSYGKISINFEDFLNGLDINVSQVPYYLVL